MSDKKKKKKLTIDTAPLDERGLVRDEDEEFEADLAERVRIAEENSEAEYLRAKKQAEADKQAYAEKLRREKIELMKHKQGIADTEPKEDEAEEDSEPAPKMSFKKKLENFWYHYKIQTIVAVTVTVLFGYMIYDLVTRIEPDITVVAVVDNGLSHRVDGLEAYFEHYCEDLNGDGEVYVQVVLVPMDANSTNTDAQNYATKLYSTLSNAETVMVIADPASEFSVEQVLFQDLTERYEGNEYVTERGIKLTNDRLREALNWTQMPEDMVLMLREPVRTLSSSREEMEESCETALEMLDKMLEDAQ